MIEAVISDFGGVLTTPLTRSFEVFAERTGMSMAELGGALGAIVAREGAHPLYEMECGRLTEAEFLAGLERALFEQVGREISCEGFTEALWSGLAPNPPMIELMASLRDEGYRLALVTNNVREWESHWRAMAPIDEIFELVVDSAFVGVRKPDPEIYELALQGLGLAGEACLFVDDLERNCVAARAAGMQTVRYRDAEQAIAEIRAALNGGA
ncbi:MAG: putative hydrolase of the superfamily [Solirubrobacteraceae bacterium]|nr:putative hydrolase of the superfamily [Solirubrobacteraceae bacterium]